MSETRVLALVACFPDRAALARRAGTGLFAVLGRLERQGLVTRRAGGFRLTRDGSSELALRRALAGAIANALP
jgi:hypothetical protein